MIIQGRTTEPAKPGAVAFPGLTSPITSISAGEFHTVALASMFPTISAYKTNSSKVTLTVLRLHLKLQNLSDNFIGKC